MEFRVCSACSKFQLTGTACIGCRSPLTLADETRFLGQTLGKYRVERVIGAGGMGVVFLATHVTLARPAALKMILPHDHDPSFRERFLREARVLAGLKHPNIVEIYDFDVSPWGLPYFVMEYLEGCSLRELTHGCPGPLPGEVVGPIVCDLSAGLSFAHRRGIVHRDIKPHNVLVTLFDGRPVAKLLDFGLAKAIALEGEATELTATGAVVGTPAYLTPEHVNGKIGAHTDQYALALLVAELLVGAPVRAGRSVPQILSEDLHRTIPAELFPPGFDARTAAALRKATSPDPVARFADLESFVEALALPPPTPSGMALLASYVLRSTAPPTAPAPVSAPSASTSAGFESTAIAPPSAQGQANERPGSTVTAPERRPRLGVWVAGAVAISVAAALLGLSSRRDAGAPSTSPPPPPSRSAIPRTDAATAASDAPLFGKLREIDVPPDAQRLLGLRGDLIVLAGDRRLYAVAADGTGLPATIPLDACTEVLGATPDGLVWCRDDTRATLLDPTPSPGAREARLTVSPLPKLDASPAHSGQRVYISATGRHFAVVQHASVDVYAVSTGKAAAPVRRVSVPIDTTLDAFVAISDRVVVVLQPGRSVRAFEVSQGASLLSQPFTELRPGAVALSPMDDRVAIGGWFDEVYVFALTPGGKDAVIHRHGRTFDLAWIPDAPTLAIAGAAGLSLWRPDEGEIAASPRDGADPGDELRFTGRGLLRLANGAHRVEVDAYRGMPLPGSVKISGKEIWALAAGADGTAFVGSSDGNLYAYRDGGVETAKLHADGITALALDRDQLASASDDKTIAVWRLPELRVEWRSRAHDFLVNQLFVAGSPPNLYSSSSDGTIKRWKWPELEEQESIATRDLFGHRYELQALWVAPDGAQILAGTWRHALLAMRKLGTGKWAGRALDVPSSGIYQGAELRALHAVVFVGLDPCGVYVYDLDDGTLAEIEHLGADLYATVAGDDQRSVTVLGDGAVLRYELDRTADGHLAYGVTAGFDSDLRAVTAATLLPPGGAIAAGTRTGELYVLDARLPGRPVLRDAVHPRATP